MNSVAILGANGFIGKELSTRFARDGWEVHELVRDPGPRSPQFLVDYGDLELMRAFFQRHPVDVVINATSPKTAYQILRVWEVLRMHHRYYGRLFNLGSGAEFDRCYPIAEPSNDFLFSRLPSEKYGFAKNLIARSIITDPRNAVNFRLFGCFGCEEADYRLFKRSWLRIRESLQPELFQDGLFDYFYVGDLYSVMQHCLENNFADVEDATINCVYETKRTLEEQLKIFLNSSGASDYNITITFKDYLRREYTGKFHSWFNDITLVGLREGIAKMVRKLR